MTRTHCMNFVTGMLQLESPTQASPKEKLALPVFTINIKMRKYRGIGYQPEITRVSNTFSNADDQVTTSTSKNCILWEKYK